MKEKLVLAIILGSSLMAASQGRDACIVNPDNSITINFKNSKADEVEVNGAFGSPGLIGKLTGMTDKMKKFEMKEDGNSWWTYTSKPLDSDLYWYNIYVDDADIPVYDKRNSNKVRDISTMYNYFIVPGKVGNDYMDRDGENGKLEYVWYPSTLKDMSKRRMAVYLPYGYSQNSSKRYPVLYLLHGSGGDEMSWAECGRLAQIMDNMIADERCEPMIVVMPNGSVNLAAAPGYDPANTDVKPTSNYTESMNGDIENVFVPEVVNYVDSHFRTIPDKKHRAIAGLSLGGLHTLFTAVNNPDTFGYIGLFSAQTVATIGNTGIGDVKEIGNKITELADNFLSIFGVESKKDENKLDTGHPEIYRDFDRKLDEMYKNQPELFYIAVGSGDFTKKLNDELRFKMLKKDYPFHYNESAGGHTWTNWRRYLRDFLPRLDFSKNN